MKKIPLSQGKCVIIDDGDYEWLNQYKWWTNNCRIKYWYAIGRVEGKSVLMHRVIMGFPKNMEIDHINGNGLDNRRSNLRIVTKSQNQMNNRKQDRKTSSKYKGVSWDSGSCKWKVRIIKNKKVIHLGRFSSQLQAAHVYDEACKKYFEEFAKSNEALYEK